MSATTTRRVRILSGVVLGALVAFAAARAGSPGTAATVLPAGIQLQKPAYVPTKSFYAAYLAPGMSYRLRDLPSPAADAFAIQTSNLWSSDPSAVRRIQSRTLRTVEGGFKSYLLERLGVDRWQFPLGGTGERGGEASGDHAGPMRFRVGFARRAPHADLLIPVSAGRVVVSADARGRVGAAYEAQASELRLSAEVDVPQHAAFVKLSVRF